MDKNVVQGQGQCKLIAREGRQRQRPRRRRRHRQRTRTYIDIDIDIVGHSDIRIYNQ